MTKEEYSYFIHSYAACLNTRTIQNTIQGKYYTLGQLCVIRDVLRKYAPYNYIDDLVKVIKDDSKMGLL